MFKLKDKMLTNMIEIDNYRPSQNTLSGHQNANFKTYPTGLMATLFTSVQFICRTGFIFM